MQTREGTFDAAGGLRLFEHAWLPEGEPRAAVALVHGYAEHSGRYEHVGQALASAGYAVEALDLRGHGRSEGERATVRTFGLYLNDLRRFLRRVRERHPGKPLFLLGHSMGGTIAALHTIQFQPELAGLVLSGPALTARDRAQRLTAPVFSVLGRLVPGLPLARLKAETVSRDPAVAAAYDADPLVYRGRMRAGMLRAFVDALNRIDRGMETIAVPLLIVHGTADELANPDGSRQLYARASSTDKRLRLYDGLAHEVLNEPEKDEVIAELCGWLDERATPGAAAGAAARRGA
ncbi:MAG TPA: lysophospholipase [Dehalococcoidia bacterium]|nr:lysophospholipase [Dehalococcoidia bacterium]